MAGLPKNSAPQDTDRRASRQQLTPAHVSRRDRSCPFARPAPTGWAFLFPGSAPREN